MHKVCKKIETCVAALIVIVGLINLVIIAAAIISGISLPPIFDTVVTINVLAGLGLMGYDILRRW